MEIKCLFNNSSLASRKICTQSLDNNFSAKTEWLKEVAQRVVFCQIGFLLKICSIFINHVCCNIEISGPKLINTNETDFQ